MSNILNTYSFSFKYDLPKMFSFNDVDIKNFLSEKLPNILKGNNEVKEKINNYKELKQFLGKKRLNKINENELKQNKKHLKDPASIKKVMLSIDLDRNENIKVNENKTGLTIYKQPIVFMQLFDSQSINIDLINDSLSYKRKIKDLKNFDYEIYSTKNKENELYISNEIELKRGYYKPIEIENENIYPFLYVMNSQIPEITEEDLLYKNIFKTLEVKNGLISPDDISKIFFYYFSISTELQKKYVYIESDNRKELYRILAKFLEEPFKKIIIIVGPKGIGKTTSLIKFSFKKAYRIFYFNLESFRLNYGDRKKAELKIQVAKLFGNTIQCNNENNEKDDRDNNKKEEEEIYSKIEKYIEENSNKDGFEFIYNIINLFKKFAKNKEGFNFGFIIDQYSPNCKYDNDKEYNINKIINLFDDSENIKLILCPVINNIFSKEDITSIFSKSLRKDNIFFWIYYFQEFIPKDKFLKYIVQNQLDEYKDFIDEFGYSPKCFYDIIHTNNYIYKKYLSKNLKDNLEEYYSFNNKNKIIDTIREILNLLDIVKSEKLISSIALRDNISKLPMKYINITKYKINDEIIKNLSDKIDEYNKINKIKKRKEEDDILIKYLNIVWNNEKNEEYDEIIENRFFIDEKDFNDFIDNYEEKDKISTNIYGNYYKNFIDNYNNLIITLEHSYKYIYVYKLDFSSNFIENILLEIIYNHTKQENLFFSKILERGACGGIFGLLLRFYIQKCGSFLGEKIENTIYISSLVPNNYSIKYYSSNYNKDRKKFIEFKLENSNSNKNKRKIPFKNTFIKQIIFNSKYYNMGILIKSNKVNIYKLIVMQAIIMKDKEKRMSKEEHELILRAVKLNLENEYEINIEEGYFIYVLSKNNGEIEDQETKKDCDNNYIEYVGFDIDRFEKENKYKINYEKAFITKSFPIHNSISLLFYNKNKEEDVINYSKFKSIIDNNIELSHELKDYDEYIIKLFKNKYDDSKISLEQFKYFDLNYSLFKNNKEILNYLSEFSFLIFDGNKGEKLYIHFKKSTYNCKKNYEQSSFKLTIKDSYQILFCYSLVPLAINPQKK